MSNDQPSPVTGMRSSPTNATQSHIPADVVGTQIAIPYIEPKLLKAALEYAASLVERTNDAQVRLIDIHAVPYGIPLRPPPIDLKHFERRLGALVRGCAFPVSIEVACARQWEHGFRRALAPHSIVLLATKNRSARKSSEKRTAARLRKQGHYVLWVLAD